MIELLGVGVRRDKSTWILHNMYARLEAGDLALVAFSRSRRGRKSALIEVVTGRRVPDEGRMWVNHVPLLRATARRIRACAAWSSCPGGRSASARSCGTPWRRRARPACWADCSVCHASGTETRCSPRSSASAFGAARRTLPQCSAWPIGLRLLVARALTRGPEHLVVSEPDAVLTSTELTVFMGLLRSIAQVERLGVMVSVANATDIWRLADRLLILDGGQLLFAGRPDDIEGARAGRVGALTT